MWNISKSKLDNKKGNDSPSSSTKGTLDSKQPKKNRSNNVIMPWNLWTLLICASSGISPQNLFSLMRTYVYRRMYVMEFSFTPSNKLTKKRKRCYFVYTYLQMMFLSIVSKLYEIKRWINFI